MIPTVFRVSNESTTVDDFLRGDEKTRNEVRPKIRLPLLHKLTQPLDLCRMGGQSREGTLVFQRYRRWVQGRSSTVSYLGAELILRRRSALPRKNSKSWVPSSMLSGTRTSRTSLTSPSCEPDNPCLVRLF